MSEMHDSKLVAALRSIKAHLETLPEQLRGPFVVEGLAPYASAKPAVMSAITVERLPMETAPKDGSMLRLFVQFDGDSSVGAFEDADQGWTIGTNNLANTGEDEWQVVGWDWGQDTYREARTAKPLGWLPFHALQSLTAQKTSERAEYDPDAPPDHSADNAADFIFRELSSALGVDGKWSVADGTETWDGDVRGTLYAILEAAGIWDDYTNRLTAQQAAEPAGELRWHPIADADSSIATIETYGGVVIRKSYPVWVRDEDGRTYEAVWTDHKGGYWWDLDGEDQADPVEFCPHPLAFLNPQPASEGETS